MINRRKMLASIAPAALVAGCGITINPTTGAVTLPANVVDFIQGAVAAAAKYIPVVESIAAAAATLFGPGFASIVTIGSQAINTLIAYLTNLIPPAAPPAPASMRAYHRLGLVPPAGAHLIGYTRNGVPIYGY